MTRISPRSERAGSQILRVPGALAIGLGFISSLSLAVLTLHVAVDVLLRTVAGRPLVGTIEIVGLWWMPLVVFTALGYAEVRGDHIIVTFITDGMQGAASAIARATALVVSILILLPLAWFTWVAAVGSFRVGEVTTGAVLLPVWPFKFLVPLGFAVWSLVMVTELVDRRGRAGRS